MGSSSATKKPTAREVAVEILREKGGGPMRVAELAKLVVESGKTKLKGKTPEATAAAHIYTAAKAGILFKKAGRGEVELLPDAAAPAVPASEPAGGKKGAAAKKSGAGAGRSSRSRKKPTEAAAPAAESGPKSRRRRGVQQTDDVAAGDAAALEETPAEPDPDEEAAGDPAEDRELVGAVG